MLRPMGTEQARRERGHSDRDVTARGSDIPVVARATGGEDELHCTLVAGAAPASADAVPNGVARGVARELDEIRHELRQPLTAIVNYARGTMMRSRNGSLTPADLERALEIIVAEALRAAGMLKRRGGEMGGDS